MSKTSIGFISALLGLCLSPGETTKKLFNDNPPRYGLPILLSFYLIIIVPVFIQSATLGMLMYHEKALAAVLIVPTLTVVLFVFLEKLFLKILSINVSMNCLATAVCYSLVPFMGIFITMYVLNYLASGSIAYLTIVLNGYAAQEVAYKQIVPWVAKGGVATSFIVFFCSLRALGNLYTLNAICASVLSIVPLLASFYTAIYAANILLKGLSGVFMEILSTPGAMLGV